MFIIEMIVIPINSVANQNAVDFLLWNAVFPLDVDCGGACIVRSDNCRTNTGHCALYKQDKQLLLAISLASAFSPQI